MAEREREPEDAGEPEFDRVVNYVGERYTEIAQQNRQLALALTEATTDLAINYAKIVQTFVLDLGPSGAKGQRHAVGRERREADKDLGKASTTAIRGATDMVYDAVRRFDTALVNTSKAVAQSLERFNEVYNEPDSASRRRVTSATSKKGRAKKKTAPKA